MTSLTELDATEISRQLAAAKISSVELVTAFLNRIEAINPTLNAIVALRSWDDILREARNADNTPRKGWLHGMPIAIKDLADTKGLTTSYGSPLFATHVPETDSRLVSQLRSSGAIIIGKTNTPEFGLGSHTYNPVYGTTRNPYDLQLSAGGSSGGAAAALAARLLPVADGSDMMGSLRNPAAFNNVYGFRPSVGRIPADNPADACSFPLSTSGPMGRSVEDIAKLLDTMVEHDPSQPWNLPSSESFASGVHGITEASKASQHIGWIADADGHYPMDKGVLSLCESALKDLEQLGCTVTPINTGFSMPKLFEAWCALRSFDMAMRLGPLYEDPSSRALLKPELQWEIERGFQYTAPQIHQAGETRSAWIATIAKLFRKYDVLCLPSAAIFPFDADEHWPKTINNASMTTYHEWMSVVVPASMAGLPTLAIPAGFNDNGLPAGLQLMGPYRDDLRVLQLGHAYHLATDWPARTVPEFS